jgi:hypothetical protein
MQICGLLEASAGFEPALRRGAYRFAGGHLTTRSRDPRVPGWTRTSGLHLRTVARLSFCATRTYVAEPGVEPGLSKTTALQAAERSVARFRRGG